MKIFWESRFFLPYLNYIVFVVQKILERATGYSRFQRAKKMVTVHVYTVDCFICHQWHSVTPLRKDDLEKSILLRAQSEWSLLLIFPSIILKSRTKG